MWRGQTKTSKDLKCSVKHNSLSLNAMDGSKSRLKMVLVPNGGPYATFSHCTKKRDSPPFSRPLGPETISNSLFDPLIVFSGNCLARTPILRSLIVFVWPQSRFEVAKLAFCSCFVARFHEIYQNWVIHLFGDKKERRIRIWPRFVSYMYPICVGVDFSQP